MWTDLNRRKFLFKTKTQSANSSNGQGGDGRHNTEVDIRMHNGDTKIVNLVGEHLQTKEKTRMGGGVGAESRKGKGEEERADLLPPPLRSVF
jgi:hypothetical protein